MLGGGEEAEGMCDHTQGGGSPEPIASSPLASVGDEQFEGCLSPAPAEGKQATIPCVHLRPFSLYLSRGLHLTKAPSADSDKLRQELRHAAEIGQLLLEQKMAIQRERDDAISQLRFSHPRPQTQLRALTS